MTVMDHRWDVPRPDVMPLAGLKLGSQNNRKKLDGGLILNLMLRGLGDSISCIIVTFFFFF